MGESTILERAALAYGPYDMPHMYELVEGVLYAGHYFFHLEDGILWLRHVRKVDHPEHTHLFIDGDSGGLQLANNVQRDLLAVVTETLDRLRVMDGLTFLIDELLWLNNRGDIELNLVKKKG
ncbi:hypothetical protein [Paenibacillus sp. FSL L8-0638]|uniref:hypothetical protein n=1 Tax=Paenibacillus TaxID=44249 RepID=UPI0031597F8C